MKKIVFTLCFLTSMQVYASNLKPEYRWGAFRSCNQYANDDDSSVVKHNINRDLCRASEGVEFKWDDYGRCNEHTPKGSVITPRVDINHCRESEGSIFRMSRMRDCHEYAPRGAVVTPHVDPSLCEANPRLTFN